jgi:hypothetical protein
VPFDLVDALDMMLWDMQGHDYSSVTVRMDGTVMGEAKPKSKSVTVKTEVVE